MTSAVMTRQAVPAGGASRVRASAQSGARATTCPVDPVVAGSAMLLLLLGLVMVASASSEVAARTYGNTFYLLIKHSVYLVIGLACAGVTLSLPMKVWQKLDWMLLLVSFALLLLVLVPGIGREVNGSTRWISLGFFTVQGSEFVKLFAIVYVAGYLVRRKDEVRSTLPGFLKPLGLVLLMSALLLKEPDFGAAVVITAAVLGMIFLAGVPMRYFAPMIAFGAVGVGIVAVWQPYRLQRLTAFIDPWQHQFGGGYQLTQALIAFGRGEWLGLGLGNSIQKLFFLPEAHTDFLFSIVAEELGIVGAMVIIIAFAVLVIRGMWIGRRAAAQGKEFHAFVAWGISLLLGIQAAINIGVNIGLLPTKGLTLPFLSYGGNSLMVSCIFVALLLRIEFECRAEATTPASDNGRTAKRNGRRGGQGRGR